jgi:hypothetical protein
MPKRGGYGLLHLGVCAGAGVEVQLRSDMRKFIGWTILAAVFSGLFVATAHKSGILEAALVWGAAIALAVAVVVAAWLVVGE